MFKVLHMLGASHAGSWRGGTVAVKVLCHEGSRTAKLNALHESVVCAHVQHPNVVSHLLQQCCAASRPGAVQHCTCAA